MEKTWKFVGFCLISSFLELCNGLPVNFERAVTVDSGIHYALGVVAIILTLCTVLWLLGCVCCHRENGFKEFRDSPVTTISIAVDNGLINPIAEGEFAVFAPTSNTNDYARLNENLIQENIRSSSWFGDEESNFPRAKLKYIKEIGKGWFGKVVQGTARGIEERDVWTPVAVRILDPIATPNERDFFFHEAEIYKCGDHKNILKLYGQCWDSVPALLVQEYCQQGDLKAYLLSNKNNANNLLASEYPLIWCCQLTSALKFLHEKGVTHPDLASRNCQLSSNLTLKLGDYGLASSQYPEDYYDDIPTISIRWCAPESIEYTSTTIQAKKVTREANIWSLGICFWEICECGTKPYADLNNEQVINLVMGKSNVRLSRPSYGVLYMDYIYRLMQSCWLTPESRPTSTQIYLTLTDLLQVFTVCKVECQNSMVNSQESFDSKWNSLEPNNLNAFEDNLVKLTSASLNNMFGSLDDITRPAAIFEERSSNDFLPNHLNDTFDFKSEDQSNDTMETDSLNNNMVSSIRRSSSSETEEDNWRTKIERGDYSEKVRQKSRSVTDLMILTHIDCFESESDTSNLDQKTNYKNVRLGERINLEKNYIHGSEGNLLSIEDDFQAELNKLQNQHKDSLQFVPDNFSKSENNEQLVTNNTDTHSSEILLNDFNSTREINPTNQVYNVFNVSINNFSPVHIAKLNNIINLEHYDDVNYKSSVSNDVLRLHDVTENKFNVIDLNDENDPKYLRKLNESNEINEEESIPSHKEELSCVIEKNNIENDDNIVDENSIIETDTTLPISNGDTNETELLSETISPKPSCLSDLNKNSMIPKLKDLIENNDELMNYIDTNYNNSEDIYETCSSQLQSTVFGNEENCEDLDSQNENLNQTVTVDNSKSDPQSLLVFETENEKKEQVLETISNSDINSVENCQMVIDNENLVNLQTENELNRTFDVETSGLNETFDVTPNSSFTLDETENQIGSWETKSGWFLHSQSTDVVSGQMTDQKDTGNYVKFGMDDEILEVLRGELLAKLPQTKGIPKEPKIEEDEINFPEHEVFWKYNAYSMPLSPIPEENEDDNYSNLSSASSECADILDPIEKIQEDDLTEQIDSQSLQDEISSQDSDCLSDTSFNFDNENESHKFKDEYLETEAIDEEKKFSDTIEVQIDHHTDSSTKFIQVNDHNVPLPSPDDHPWKHLLSASLQKYDCHQNKGLESTAEYEIDQNSTSVNDEKIELREIDNETEILTLDNIQNEEDENFKHQCDDNVVIPDTISRDSVSGQSNDQIFGLLTNMEPGDPGESHLMSTSFNECSDMMSDQDWDSGSDTRSSSSGEFIWKEGEYEESLKALQALPQDTLNDVDLKECNRDETSTENSYSDEEDCPEFIPSAWNKYAIPEKSALRLPEKKLKKEEQKKGVCFKKQRYHSVYEYPKEPESPIQQNFDAWRSPSAVSSYPEWFCDNSSINTDLDIINYTGADSIAMDYNLGYNNNFCVTSSETPFNMSGMSTSQFFPGSDIWLEVYKLNENTTPDSGVEDITPASVDLTDCVPPLRLPPLKVSTDADSKSTQTSCKEALGDLRHTRDKLKLDLSPIINSFTSNNPSNLETDINLVDLRERPFFTTFGKSRFLVQQVDTSENGETGNVCFEVLPYKPMNLNCHEENLKKNKKEEKGEASLLDSADEDSGIESSVLEIKSNDIADN